MKKVEIKSQVWGQENLRVTKFRNGDDLIEVKSDKDWKEANKKKKPAYCYFRNDLSKDVLYNCWAIEDSRGLAPDGWRLPDETDFYKLLKKLDGNQSAFHAQKKPFLSRENEVEGNDKFKFYANPTGCRDKEGVFAGDGAAYFWSASKGGLVLTRELSAYKSHYRNSQVDENGLAVRLLKITPVEQLSSVIRITLVGFASINLLNFIFLFIESAIDGTNLLWENVEFLGYATIYGIIVSIIFGYMNSPQLEKRLLMGLTICSIIAFISSYLLQNQMLRTHSVYGFFGIAMGCKMVLVVDKLKNGEF
jgi:uncharacterized protein (TIGR02145 family)